MKNSQNTAEQNPAGLASAGGPEYRFVTVEEMVTSVPDDAEWWNGFEWRASRHRGIACPSTHDMDYITYRTKTESAKFREDIEAANGEDPWNPDGVTQRLIPDGWRLLFRSELDPRKWRYPGHIRGWDGVKFHSAFVGTSLSVSYITDLSPSELKKHRRPV